MNKLRRVKIILNGEPMAKQSVRQGKSWGGKKIFFQPEKYEFRESQYRAQIRKQLPKDFVMFSEWVEVVEINYIFEPRKDQLKHKAKRRWLEFGGLIPKPSRPDIIDNLAKLPFDSMSQVLEKLKKGVKRERRVLRKGVFKDDGIVYMVKQSAKWYGLNPRIEIELIGV